MLVCIAVVEIDAIGTFNACKALYDLCFKVSYMADDLCTASQLLIHS